MLNGNKSLKRLHSAGIYIVGLLIKVLLGRGLTEALFFHCCPDFPSCSANAIEKDWVTWVIWVAIMKYNLELSLNISMIPYVCPLGSASPYSASRLMFHARS